MPAKSVKRSWLQMGMPITVEIVGERSATELFRAVQDWFTAVDNRFSPFRPDSEVSRINAGLPFEQWSREMQQIVQLCEQTKQQTNGYFDAYFKGHFDPSGIVKGWAIERAATLLIERGERHFYIDAGGDVATRGHNADDEPWRIGIRNPFGRDEVVKVLRLQDAGVATSGAYIRGDHIYNPLVPDGTPSGVASMTVIGPNVYEADRFATAAYAMGRRGIEFIEALDGFEAYMIAPDGVATMTTYFEKYVS